MSILGLDIGTTGTKGIVFNESGKVLASHYLEYKLLFPKPGWVEFDTMDMWDKVFEVIKAVNNTEEVKKDPIIAMSTSTVGESFTPVDREGRILYNTIYSTDARSVKELDMILSRYSGNFLYNKTGYPAKYICPLNKILWVKNNLPEIYNNAYKFLFTPDLLKFKLGIRDTKINYALCSRTLFFDIREKKWMDDLLNDFGIDPQLFSTPSPSGVIAGTVDKSIAQELGFSKEVTVVVGSHDQPCAALGVGAIKGGIAADGMGTVECVTTCMDDIVINSSMLQNNFATQVHAQSDKYVTLAYNMTCGSVVKWYKDNIAKDPDNYKPDLSFEPSDLYALPYFSATGTPYMDPIPKGSIIGMSLDTKREDLFKALIEGLVFEISFNLELAEKAGVKIEELRAVGGGSKSDYELQLKSSITGHPIKRMDISEAGCLATMMLAGSGIGQFSLDEAIARFVKVKDEFYPDECIRERYLDKFEKYKSLYKIVSQLY